MTPFKRSTVSVCWYVFISVSEKEKLISKLSILKKEIETVEYIVYHKDLPQNVVIDLDHTGKMGECIVNSDFTLAYSLEVLPRDGKHVSLLQQWISPVRLHQLLEK